MKAYTTNLLNAVILIGTSVWSFLGEVRHTVPTLVFMVLGVILLSLNNGVQYRIKSQFRTATAVSLAAALYCLYNVWYFRDSEHFNTMVKFIVAALTSSLAFVFMMLENRPTKPTLKK